MWFRGSGGGGCNNATVLDSESRSRHGSGSSESNAQKKTTTAPKTTIGVPVITKSDDEKKVRISSETSTFEKFRRASFRRKSSNGATAVTATPICKRSKLPHAILEPGSGFSSVENGVQKEQQEDTNKVGALRLLLKTPVAKPMNNLSTHKSMKTDPPKHKFYKFSSINRQNSEEKRAPSIETDVGDANLSKPIVLVPTNSHKTKDFLQDAGYKVDDNEDFADDDDDDDEDDDNDDVDDDDDYKDEDNNYNDLNDFYHYDKKSDENQRRRCKERILLTDPKYKNNRIEKSSSKTKINNASASVGDKIVKHESIKRSRSVRKISAPPILTDNKTASATFNSNSSNKKSTKKNEKETRFLKQSPHLNLQAFVKFVVSNRKFLNTEDFALIRRKSISEAASTMIAVAACKPLPIALRYSAENVVAEIPKENDTKAERNVVLINKKNLQNSSFDQSNSAKLFNTKNARLRKYCDKDSLMSGENSKGELGTKVKRNSSNGSNRSGNYEDEAFYSCDEQESEQLKNNLAEGKIAGEKKEQAKKGEEKKRKSSSPSITSRVAAKFNETTNNIKNHKAAKSGKKRKALSTVDTKWPELYKQLSVGKRKPPNNLYIYFFYM